MKQTHSRRRPRVEFSRVGGEAGAAVRELESQVHKRSSSGSNPRWFLVVRQFKSNAADANEVLTCLVDELVAGAGTEAIWQPVDIERAKTEFDVVMANGLAYRGLGPFRESLATNRALFVGLFREDAQWFVGKNLSNATFEAALGVLDRNLVGLVWQSAED